MATFKDKNTGKLHDTRAANINAFKALLTASGTTKEDGREGADIDGKRHEFVDFGKIPFRVKQGDQKKFFPGIDRDNDRAGILTGSIVRNTVDKIVYIPLKATSYVENMIGPGSHRSKSLAAKHGNSRAYTQISASFVRIFKNHMNSDRTVTFAVEENYNSPSASAAINNTPAVTASLALRAYGSTDDRISYSGQPDFNIPNITNGHKITFDISDSVAAHEFFMRNSGGNDFYVETFFPSFSIAFQHGDGSDTGSYFIGIGNVGDGTDTIKSNPFTYVTKSGAPFFPGADAPGAVTPAFTQSEAVLAKGTIITDADNVSYCSYLFKGMLAGDSNSGSAYDNFTFKDREGNEVSDDACVNIFRADVGKSSGSFKYVPIASGAAASQTSTDVRTIHFPSGSGGESTPGFQGIFTGSGASLLMGSFLFNDPKLRYSADDGYYCPTGSDVTGNPVFECKRTTVPNMISGSHYNVRVARKAL